MTAEDALHASWWALYTMRRYQRKCRSFVDWWAEQPHPMKVSAYHLAWNALK